MALVAADLYIPAFLVGASPTISNILIDAANEKAGSVFRAPKTGSVTKIGWMLNVITTGATVDVRLETVNLTTGAPSGTLFGTNTNGASVVGAADDSLWRTTTLTAAASVTKGELLAVVIANPSSSFGNMNVGRVQNFANGQFPYTAAFTGSWAKQAQTPCCALEYSDGSYANTPAVMAFNNIILSVFNVNTSGADERGNAFTLPFSARVSGAWWSGIVAAGADYELILYEGTTARLTYAHDGNVDFDNSQGRQSVQFDSTYVIKANTEYRLAIRPTTTNNISLVEVYVDSVALMNTLELGAACAKATRVDQGAWAGTVTTSRALMGIVVDQIDVGSVLAHPGMRGGFRG